MMNVLAKRLLAKVPWGLKLRVSLGASLSLADMVSDVYVIRQYLQEEKTEGYGWTMMGMVGGCIILQCLVVFLQNRRKPSVLAKEVIVALSGLKPAWDAWFVVAGTNIEDFQVFEKYVELTFTRLIEMFAESIPGEEATRNEHELQNTRNAQQARTHFVHTRTLSTNTNTHTCTPPSLVVHTVFVQGVSFKSTSS